MKDQENLKKCKKCKCKLRGNTEYCPRCEYEIEWLNTPENFCYCGKLIPNDKKRCETCENADDSSRKYYQQNQEYLKKYHREYMARRKAKISNKCIVCGNPLTKNGFCRKCHSTKVYQDNQDEQKRKKKSDDTNN